MVYLPQEVRLVSASLASRQINANRFTMDPLQTPDASRPQMQLPKLEPIDV